VYPPLPAIVFTHSAEGGPMKKLYSALLFSMAGALAACSDTSTAPQQVAEPSVQTAARLGSMQDLAGTDTARFTITIDPSKNSKYNLGAGNSLYFPAGSLCSLSSSYGKDEWDKPCVKTAAAVDVNVKAWLDRYGNPRVDFDKHIRFVPTTNPAEFVMLQFSDRQASLNPFFNILYCPALPGESGSSSCYDESTTDVSLVTVRDPLNGKVTRRIKHFSGYNVAAGEEGEGDGSMFNIANDDFAGMSISVDDFRFNTIDAVRGRYTVGEPKAREILERIGAARSLSGYILASGLDQ
jgi:hypothetical protein